MRTIVFLALAVGIGVAYRLPTSLTPQHYNLQIITNLGDEDGNFKFGGDVTIHVTCSESTSNITLHSVNLSIPSKSIELEDATSGEKRKIAGYEFKTDDDFLVIRLEEPLVAQHVYKVRIPFDGLLTDNLYGYYRSSYVDSSTKEKRWIGVTQFEPTYARRAFPCFDEPSLKATFDISLGRMGKYHSVSNMPLARTEPMTSRKGWFWDRYETSVPMSTYLVAFMVSDLESEISEAVDGNNVTFKIWARKDATGQMEFARRDGPKYLRFFEEFFDIPYPLPKQDMVALPDFNAGAMENWGMITYREVYLLHDPLLGTVKNKENVASVIAHELAHQWFGNLVTMKWWTDLWLNEGFATYMASLAVARVHPEWKTLDENAIDDLQRVFGFDSLLSSHPVSVPIGNPSEIEEIFDTISYKKGSSLIRMMGLFLGESTLRKGVSEYLKKHEYGNAEQDDLWESLTRVAHENGALPRDLTVKTIMDTWTVQTGYPVVNVRRNYEAGTVDMEQRRYLRNASATTTTANQCWWIPVTFTSRSEKDFRTTSPKQWLPCTKRKTFGGFRDIPDDEWLLFNIKGAGLYRVNYDMRNWQMLVDALNSDNFTDICTFSRLQLIEDSSSLAWTGHLPYDVFFSILKYLGAEKEYLPWKAALQQTGVLNRLLKKTSRHGKFKDFMRGLVESIYRDLGGLSSSSRISDEEEEKSPDQVKHRSLVVSQACAYELSDCVTYSKDVFGKMKDRSSSGIGVPKDLKATVYCVAVRYGGQREWEELWEMYKKSNVATEKSTIMNALSCSREVWILQRYLEWTLDQDSGIRKQDVATIFSGLFTNPVGYYVAKKFLHTKIQQLHNSVGSVKSMSKIIASYAEQTTDKEDYDDLVVFVGRNRKYLGESRQAVEQSLERARLNVQWHEMHYRDFGKILDRLVRH